MAAKRRRLSNEDQSQGRSGDKDFPQPFLSAVKTLKKPRFRGQVARVGGFWRAQSFSHNEPNRRFAMSTERKICKQHASQDGVWPCPGLALPASSRPRCLLAPSSMDSPRTRCLNTPHRWPSTVAVTPSQNGPWLTCSRGLQPGTHARTRREAGSALTPLWSAHTHSL